MPYFCHTLNATGLSGLKTRCLQLQPKLENMWYKTAKSWEETKCWNYYTDDRWPKCRPTYICESQDGNPDRKSYRFIMREGSKWEQRESDAMSTGKVSDIPEVYKSMMCLTSCDYHRRQWFEFVHVFIISLNLLSVHCFSSGIYMIINLPL
jgi:hypothetical protein